MTALVSDADLAAARVLLGMPEAPGILPGNTLRAMTIVSTNGADSFLVEERIDTIHGGVYHYCPCMGWKFSQQTPKRCRHTDDASFQWLAEDHRANTCDDCGAPEGEMHDMTVEH